MMSMESFLRDKRLVKWFTQNYDLSGCNAYTCSSIQTQEDAALLLEKVVPIPIGLDLHSAAEKRFSGSDQIETALCDQRQDIERAQAASLPFLQRKVSVLVGFHCGFDNTKIGLGRKKTRGEICDLLSSSRRTQSNISVVSVNDVNSNNPDDKERSKRVLFWRGLGEVAFALAPAGFGTDTHR